MQYELHQMLWLTGNGNSCGHHAKGPSEAWDVAGEGTPGKRRVPGRMTETEIQDSSDVLVGTLDMAEDISVAISRIYRSKEEKEQRGKPRKEWRIHTGVYIRQGAAGGQTLSTTRDQLDKEHSTEEAEAGDPQSSQIQDPILVSTMQRP